MMNNQAHTWLTLHCQVISGVKKAILMLKNTSNDTIALAACLPNKQADVGALVRVGKLAFQNKKPLLHKNQLDTLSNNNCPTDYVCAFLLTHQESVIGTLVIQVDEFDQKKIHAVQKLLHRSSTWLHLSTSDNESSTIAARLSTVLEITAKSLEKSTLQESATSVITYLTQAFSCDRVSIGHLVDKNKINVTAISHSTQIDRRTDRVQHIEAAMEESLDEARSLTFPPQETSTTWPAQKQVCSHHNNGAVCTLLLNNNGRATGALTFERHNGHNFDQTTIDILEAITAMIGPIFEMKRLQERPLLAKASQFVSATLGRLIGSGHLKGKLTAIAAVFLCLFLSLVSNTYRVSAEATLEGTEHRALVAAIDGFVDQAHLRAGEQVSKGDLIATLDTTILEMKQRQLISERSNLVKRHDQAIGGLDRAEATIIQAQLGKANAQLSLIEEQIERTQIVAPIDGIIVSGDLSHTLGAPVERGQVLFEIAPLDSYRMALQVNETDIAYVQPGQQGFLALAAAPGERLRFIVEDIIGIALTDEGRNGFRVEAKLDPDTTQLRPGMRGVGKIETTKRSLMWIWGHTIFDRLALWIWSNLP